MEPQDSLTIPAWGMRLRVEEPGFRAQAKGLALRVWGAGFRVNLFQNDGSSTAHTIQNLKFSPCPKPPCKVGSGESS